MKNSLRHTVTLLLATALLIGLTLTPGRSQDPAPAADNAGAAADNAAADDTRIAAFDKTIGEMLARGIPLSEWLMAAAAEHHFNLLLARNLPAGDLHLTLRNVQLGVAISAACASQGCRISIAHNIVFVWPQTAADNQPARDCQSFRVDAAVGDFDALLAQVRQLVGAGGIVVGHTASRVLFVVDTADARKAVTRYIEALEQAAADAADTDRGDGLDGR